MRCGAGILWVVLVCAGLGCGLAGAAPWYVDKDNASGVEDGLSWSTAFPTVQAAIDAAHAAGGGEVWVAEGVYDEARTSLMHVPRIDTGSVVLRPGVAVYGGFGGTEASRDERDWLAHETVLDGWRARGGHAAYHVVVGANGAVLDGVVVRGGKADAVAGGTVPQDAGVGAGMFNDAVSPRVANCAFTDNVARYEGGGMYNRNGSPQIAGCRFEGNRGWDGGGIANFGATPSITDCAFLENATALLDGGKPRQSAESNAGGAVSARYGTATLQRCRFVGNTSVSNGGAVGVAGDFDAGRASLVVEDCSFSGNAAYSGGALHVALNATAAIRRCAFLYNEADIGGGGAFRAIVNSKALPLQVSDTVFWNNTARAYGGGIHAVWSNVELAHCTFHLNQTTDPDPVSGGAIHSFAMDESHGVTAVNCVFWGDSPFEFSRDGGLLALTYSLVKGGFDGEGNIKLAPVFAAPQAGDLRLAAGSAGIDAGTGSSATPVDLWGVARPQGPAVDMGAHEWMADLPDADGDGIPDAFEGAGDSDHDGTPDAWDSDSDDDGLPDAQEGAADVDGDGASNSVDTDSDGDGYADDVEAAHEMAVYGFDRPDLDPDEDGLPTAEEMLVGTHPYRADTDDDGMPDGYEVEQRFNPVDPADAVKDSDGDGVSNLDEYTVETDPRDALDPPEELYVSVEGSDVTGTGLLHHPWRTIARAVSVYNAGRYSSVSPVRVNLSPGTFNEAVTLPANVALVGDSTATTIISYYNATDDEHVIVRGGDGASLQNLRVKVPGVPAAVVVMVRIEDVSMEVSNVLLDGNYSPFSVGILISGEDSNGTRVRDAVFRRMQNGVWAVNSAAVITRNEFVDIRGDALMIRLPEEKEVPSTAVPWLGDAAQLETTGLNRFRGVDGYCVWNGSPEAAPAANNDWGVYSQAGVAAKVRGAVDFEPFLGMPLTPGAVALRLRDAGTGEEIAASANPRAAMMTPDLPAVRDESTGLFLVTGAPSGFRVVSGAADGYAVGVRALTVAEGGVAGVELALLPAGELHPANVDRLGGVNALDVQLVINGALGMALPLVDADINDDGHINAMDVQLVINAALGVS